MAQKKPNAAIPRDPQRGGGSVYPPPPQGQDLSKVSTQNGVQGIVGKGGNFQPLGQAAQTRLTGGLPPPPEVKPAVQPPTGMRTLPGGPSVFHSTNPAAGVGNDPTQQQGQRTPPYVDPAQVGAEPLQLDGQPGQMDTAQALQHLNSYLTQSKNPAGAPGVASMDGMQGGQPGPAGMFNHPGQQLGVGDDQTQQQGGGAGDAWARGEMQGQPGGWTGTVGVGGLPTKPMAFPGGDVGAGGIAFNPAMRQTLKGILAGGGKGIMGQPRPTQPVLAGGARL